MKMLTQVNRRNLPTLYSTENVANDDKIVQVKFFCPWNQWTWYAVEFDGEDIFYGYVVGQDSSWGYFSLAEMKSVRGKWGLKIERDMHFPPKRFGDIKEISHV